MNIVGIPFQGRHECTARFANDREVVDTFPISREELTKATNSLVNKTLADWKKSNMKKTKFVKDGDTFRLSAKKELDKDVPVGAVQNGKLDIILNEKGEVEIAVTRKIRTEDGFRKGNTEAFIIEPPEELYSLKSTVFSLINRIFGDSKDEIKEFKEKVDESIDFNTL